MVFSVPLAKGRESTSIKLDHFLSNPSQLIIFQSSDHSTVYGPDTDSVTNKQTNKQTNKPHADVRERLQLYFCILVLKYCFCVIDICIHMDPYS
jgi:hypothetical protein